MEVIPFSVTGVRLLYIVFLALGLGALRVSRLM